MGPALPAQSLNMHVQPVVLSYVKEFIVYLPAMGVTFAQAGSHRPPKIISPAKDMAVQTPLPTQTLQTSR